MKLLKIIIILLIVLIAMALTPGVVGGQAHTVPIRVCFVEDESSPYINKDRVFRELESALGWWAALDPDPIPYFIDSDHECIIYRDDPLQDLEWKDERLSREGKWVYIVESTEPIKMQSGYYAYAIGDYFVQAVYSGSTNDESIMAHEFGHTLYSLPDLYIWYKDYCLHNMDIMCYPTPAYNTRVVGKMSAENLGWGVIESPKYNLYMPDIER